MVKCAGIALVGFVIGAFVGGVLFDSGPGVELVPFLFGVAGAGIGLLVGVRVFRRGAD